MTKSLGIDFIQEEGFWKGRVSHDKLTKKYNTCRQISVFVSLASFFAIYLVIIYCCQQVAKTSNLDKLPYTLPSLRCISCAFIYPLMLVTTLKNKAFEN